MLGVFKLNLGIDFSAGTRVEVLANEPLTEAGLQEQLEKIGHPSMTLSFLVIRQILALFDTKMSSNRKK